MGKRKFTNITAKEVGFCWDQHFLPVRYQEFDYFDACDASIVLCNQTHKSIPGFIHQLIPAQFLDVDMTNFVRFVNRRVLKRDADPNFELWSSLLSFLGYKYQTLKQFATGTFGPIAALTAWKRFGLIQNDKEVCRKVEHCDENADFFHAHNVNVVIQKPLTQHVYVPTEILELLSPEQIIMRDSELIYNKRCQYYFKAITFLNTTEFAHNVQKVCEILAQNGYILVRSRGNKDIIGVADPSSKLNSVYLDGSIYTDYKQHVVRDEFMRVYVLSPTDMCYSSNTKFDSEHGFSISGKDPTHLRTISLWIANGLKLSKDAQEFAAQYTQAELEQEVYKCPISNPNLPRAGNLRQLKMCGYEETTDWNLEKV